MGVNTLLRSIDDGVTNMLGSWNSYSTGLATLLIAIVVYRVLTALDPDVHPFLLARQAEHNRIRMPGESPIYAARYTERPTTGLNIRDKGPGGQKPSLWVRGRDGDLRDVWSQAVAGAEPVGRGLGGVAGEQSEPARLRGKILTVLGKKVVENKMGESDGCLSQRRSLETNMPDRRIATDCTRLD